MPSAGRCGFQGGTAMNLPTLATDNITEVLLKIIVFTQTRQKILIQNINSVHTLDFVPKDLPVDEFSNLICRAIGDSDFSHRLVLRDGQNVKFGTGGNFEAMPIIDEQAKLLLAKDRNEYLRVQINKLLENSLNQRIATELLKQKQADCSGFSRCVN
jgi:hypothetical protein